MGGSIGFIGLGRMGRPMAANLVRKGFAAIVYDTVPESVSAVVRHGAKAASSVADLARNSEIVFTVLPTHEERTSRPCSTRSARAAEHHRCVSPRSPVRSDRGG